MKHLLKYIEILIIVGLLTGCAASDKEEVNGENVKETFLTTLFTSNANERYTNFVAEEKKENFDEEKSIETYYSNLESFVTETCLDELINTRFPYNYDTKLDAAGIKITVEKVTFETKDDKTEEFRVDVTVIKEDGQEEDAYIRGQIGMDGSKEASSVDYFYMSEYSKNLLDMGIF